MLLKVTKETHQLTKLNLSGIIFWSVTDTASLMNRYLFVSPQENSYQSYQLFNVLVNSYLISFWKVGSVRWFYLALALSCFSAFS